MDKRPQTLADLLAQATAPKPRIGKDGQPIPPRTPRQATETDAYIAMLQRQIRGLERRVIDDPAYLSAVIMLAQQLAEIVPVVVATSHDAHHIDPMLAPSMAECAALLGIRKQSATDKRKAGDRIISARLAAAGVESMSIARREREARERAAAYAARMMPQYHQARHLRAV